MPKRRKAPKKATVSDSEDEAATEVHEPPRRWVADSETEEPKNEAQSKAQTLVDDLEAAGWSIRVILQIGDLHAILAAAAVQDKVSALLRMADDAAASMNNELRVQLVKIPKQVRAEAVQALQLFNLC